MQKYIPDLYYKNIYEINYEKLKKKNIKTLLFDLDNTIVEAHQKKVSKKAKTLMQTLKKQGFTVMIFSNSPSKRVKRFEKACGVQSYASACKPVQIGFRRAFKKYHLQKKETAIIGDQIVTDIVGGNTFGITTILVTPLTSRDFWLTKINRYRENKILAKLEAKGVWKRGKYDT